MRFASSPRSAACTRTSKGARETMSEALDALESDADVRKTARLSSASQDEFDGVPADEAPLDEKLRRKSLRRRQADGCRPGPQPGRGRPSRWDDAATSPASARGPGRAPGTRPSRWRAAIVGYRTRLLPPLARARTALPPIPAARASPTPR